MIKNTAFYSNSCRTCQVHTWKYFFKASALKWARTLGVLLGGSLPPVYSIWPIYYFFYSCTFSKTQRAITHFIFEQHRSYVHFHVFNACKMRSFWHIFTPQNWQLDSWDSRSFPSTSSASGVTQISSAAKPLYEILEHSKCPTIP